MLGGCKRRKRTVCAADEGVNDIRKRFGLGRRVLYFY